ncbi:MAG: hypothetical protein JW716_00870 [Candidatus Aenigmarchaeota archaeon]|nr:hypothetical protein [Candidatus Aenigmarchaeota archaeon]
MGREHKYIVTFRQTREMYLPSFCHLVREGATQSGYIFEGFSGFVPDPSKGIFEFYVSGKARPENNKRLKGNLAIYGVIEKSEKIQNPLKE